MTGHDRLVEAFRAGDDIAFVSLYNIHKRSVYLFGLKMLGDTDEAKDIVQGVFLKAYERRQQLADGGKFKAWLLAIARNDCLTRIRKSGFQTHLSDEHSELPASSLETDEEIAIIRRAVGRLAPEQREVVILREYEDLSYRDIATVTGASEGTVKSRLFAARRRLYEILKPVFAERRTP